MLKIFLAYKDLLNMSEEKGVPVVIDNGSGMCKAGLSGDALTNNFSVFGDKNTHDFG